MRVTDGVQGSLLIATMSTTPAQTRQPDVDKPSDLLDIAKKKRIITAAASGSMFIELLDQPNVDQI